MRVLYACLNRYAERQGNWLEKVCFHLTSVRWENLKNNKSKHGNGDQKGFNRLGLALTISRER